MRPYAATTHRPLPAVQAKFISPVADCTWLKVAATSGNRRMTSTFTNAPDDLKTGDRLRAFYIGGLGRYREICADAADEGYRGFTLA